jgi:hypothetical protein
MPAFLRPFVLFVLFVVPRVCLAAEPGQGALSADEHSYTIDGKTYQLGCLPLTELAKQRFPRFGAPASDAAEVAEDINLLPESAWRESDWREYRLRTLDQNGTNECCPHAGVAAVEMAYARAGIPCPKLSPAFTYRWINGGRDAGAAIPDCLEALQKQGACPESVYGSQLDWRRKLTPEMTAAALDRRVLEAYYCDTFEAQASALTRGFVVVYGLYVGNNFSVGSNGWVGEYRGGGGGHALLAVGLARHPTTGKWGLVTLNSWGEGWGQRGMGIVPRSYNTAAFGAFAVRAVTRPPDRRFPPLAAIGGDGASLTDPPGRSAAAGLPGLEAAAIVAGPKKDLTAPVCQGGQCNGVLRWLRGRR